MTFVSLLKCDKDRRLSYYIFLNEKRVSSQFLGNFCEMRHAMLLKMLGRSLCLNWTFVSDDEATGSGTVAPIYDVTASKKEREF